MTRTGACSCAIALAAFAFERPVMSSRHECRDPLPPTLSRVHYGHAAAGRLDLLDRLVSQEERKLGTDVLGGQPYGCCDCALAGVGTHERECQSRHPGSKQLCRRDVNGVERSKRMICDQDLGGLEHFTGDLDQRPELTVDGKALQDLGHSPFVKRAVSHSTAQSAAHLHRQQG